MSKTNCKDLKALILQTEEFTKKYPKIPFFHEHLKELQKKYNNDCVDTPNRDSDMEHLSQPLKKDDDTSEKEKETKKKPTLPKAKDHERDM